MLADILTAILAALIFGGGGWYLFEFIRYMRSGQYDVDKRFREVTDQLRTIPIRTGRK